jgi:hypothetical protein
MPPKGYLVTRIYRWLLPILMLGLTAALALIAGCKASSGGG